MAWIKVPAANEPLFYPALPKDPRISTLRMFGSEVALIHGHLFAGLFARAAMVKLSEADYAEALQLDGAEPFDPMGTGRPMGHGVLLPETIMDEPNELRDWFRKAFDYAVSLPPKKKKGGAKKAPAKKTPAKKPPAKKTLAKKTLAKKTPAKKRR